MPDKYEQQFQDILISYRNKKDVTQEDLEQAVRDIFGVIVQIQG